MTQAVLCPGCQKRFSLPENPPKVFTCTQCQTPMDLTAFGGGEPPPPSPAPSGGAPRAGGSGARRRRPPPRGAPPPEHGRPRQGNPAAVWGVIGIVVLLGFVIIVSNKGPDIDDEPAPRKRAAVKPAPLPVEEVGDVAPPRVPYKKRKERSRTRKGKPRISNVKLQRFEWPEELDAATKTQIEDSIMQMYRGGRDGVEAGEWLVNKGHIVAGRLISEFKAIKESPGFDNREGASMASVIDGTLRRIDGFIEREWKETAKIRAWGIYAAPSFIERTAKRWTWWWKHDEWKTNPQKPWDPHEEIEGMEDGYKRPGKKRKPRGYDKPAGSG